MDIDAIQKKLEQKIKPKQTLSKQYGVMGLCLGQELKGRLKAYAQKKDIKMATLIKELVIAYLDKVESKDQENTNGLDQIDHMEKRMLLNQEMDNT